MKEYREELLSERKGNVIPCIGADDGKGTRICQSTCLFFAFLFAVKTMHQSNARVSATERRDRYTVMKKDEDDNW